MLITLHIIKQKSVWCVQNFFNAWRKNRTREMQKFTIPRVVFTYGLEKEGEVIFEVREIHMDRVYLDKNIGDVVDDI